MSGLPEPVDGEGAINEVQAGKAIAIHWSEVVLLPLFKKGDKQVCFYCNVISVIDFAAKVVGVILLRRFQS